MTKFTFIKAFKSIWRNGFDDITLHLSFL